MYKALHLRDDTDYMHQEKKEEKDSLALRIALMHQSRDLLKSAKKNYINSKKEKQKNK